MNMNTTSLDAENARNESLEAVTLKHDNGEDLAFQGRLFSECSWFDEETQSITRQKLYVTDSNEHVYYIMSGDSKRRSRRAYRVSVLGDHCIIHNGQSEMVLQFDMLMLAVRGLCGLDAAAAPTLAAVEETLKAANG